MSNILIHPGSGIIEFITGVQTTALSNNFNSGILATRMSYDGLGGINISSYASLTGTNGTSGLDRLTIDGTKGRLFSVTDALSGSLMSVNDIAGLPILEVFDNNSIVIGQFNKNDFVLSGNSLGIGMLPQTGTYKLNISGDTNINGTLYISGNRVLTGSAGSVDLSSYATNANLALTGSNLSGAISTVTSNLFNTGSNLLSTISNISGRTVDLLNSGSLLFTVVNSTTRRLDNYLESGTKYIVRSAQFNSSKLELTLATFNPSLTFNSVTPSTSPSWDQPVTNFSVNVGNPSDYTSQWINSVYYFTGVGLTATGTGNFVPAAPSTTPAGGVNWTQSWGVGSVGKIYSNASAGSSYGGTATLIAYFKDNNGNYDPSWNATQTISWASVSNGLSVNSLNGTFLQSFNGTTYSVNCYNLSSQSNRTHSLSSVGGTLANNGTNISDGTSYTFTFSTPLHKDNTSQTRTISLNTTFTRPKDIISNSSSTYTASTVGPNSVGATFNYPSFWLLTNGGTTPINSNIVNGTSFYTANGVTQLSVTKNFSSSVSNPNSTEKVFWFGVRSSSTQPTTFLMGADSSYTPGVAYSTATVSLQPTSPPQGYIAESYNLYGISLQPNSTNYIVIS